MALGRMFSTILSLVEIPVVIVLEMMNKFSSNIASRMGIRC